MSKDDTIDFTQGDICWTTSPLSQAALNGMPGIELRGYQQEYSATIAAINRWYERIAALSDLETPYVGLYVGKPTNKYILPYFSEYHHNITQAWEENSGPLGSKIAEMTTYVEAIAKTVLPAAGIIFPKSYAGAGASSFAFTFNLINTNAGNGAELSNNVNKNRKFIERFTRDNLHDMNNSLSVSPPLIYEVYIPGVRWSPAAVVSGLTINNKGTMNKNHNDLIAGQPKEYIFPDAWEVTISITELINESRSIYDDAIKGGGMDGGITTRVFEK